MNIKRISAVVMSLAMIGTSLPFSDIAISFADKNIITANAEEGYATDAYPETNEPSSNYYEDATMAETEPWTDAYESTEVYEATNAYYDEYETTRDCSDDAVATTEKYLSSGKCGDDVYYTLTNDGVLTISGSGEIGYNSYYSPFYDKESIKSVIIEDGITSIGHDSFKGCLNLENVVIPDSVTSIGKDAFEYCENLTSIVIPDSVTSIGIYATYGCENLKDVYYSGTESDWNKISIGEYNSGILNANIHFLGEDPPTSETTGTEVEFEIGNISAKAGDGYGEEGSDTEWSVILPIMVNNDTGLAGINGTLNVSSDLAKVFQLEKISLENEDIGKDGPYTGTFTAEAKNWAYSIACSGYRNWEKQPDGTPFIYYYIKVTKDKSLIARVADEMGIELDSDENGSYYKFPIEWNTSNSDANVISDINQIERIPLLKNGSIKVYVNSEVETTEPVTTTEPVATTTRPIATTGYRTTAVTTTTQVPMKASPKSTTIEVGESFSIKIDAADNPSVKYITNPTNVVVVDANGKVTGINSGETSILVYTSDGRSDTVKVTVLPASVATTVARTTSKVTYAPLVVEPKSTEILVNESFDIAVSGGDGNYTFTSIDNNIVEVGSNGTVLGIEPGTAIITVKDGLGQLTTIKVVVNPLPTTAATTLTRTTTTRVTYADLVVNPRNITLVVGDGEKINVSGGDGNYTFVSSDEDVAIVGSNGNIIGLKPGISVITVTDSSGQKESIIVTVIRHETTAVTTTRITTTTRVTYADLTVEPSLIIFDVNESVKITVSGGDGNYAFESNDESIAEIGQNGLVTGLKPGETVIKVRDGEGNLATVKVTVKQPATTTVATPSAVVTTTTTTTVTTRVTTTITTNPPLKASPDEITIPEGGRASITVTGGDGDYKFVVSDEDYVIVSSYGTVMGLKPGTAIVTVIDGEGNTDTVYVYVTALIYTTTEITYRTTARTTTRTTYRTWSTDPWEETTHPQASEEVSRETEASWEATTERATTDPWATEPSTILGDVNADYEVDSKDAVLVLKYYAAELVNTNSAVAIISSAADVNDDGKINSKDAISILRYYAEEIAGNNPGSMSDFVSSDVPDAMETVEIATITIGTVTVKPGTKTVDVPVTIFNNSKFAGGGFVFNFDSDLTFNKLEDGFIYPEYVSNNNSVSVTFARSENITENGVMFTLQFELPENAKSGDAYNIYINNVDTFCDEYRYDLLIQMVGGAIKVDDEEYETTEPATTARPVYSTTSTTRRTTAVSYDSSVSTTRSKPEFVIGNISAKPGYGYGKDDTDKQWPLSVPLKINKDCGIAGISASIDVDDNFKKVFQLESISLSDDGYSGPYSGRFITNLDYWEFALSNSLNGNWRVQPDGTPIIWYNIKITEDESVIASAAENLGIELAKDSKGTYYKFPLEWSNYKVVDTSGTKIESSFKSGYIRVYVGGESETTSATWSTDPWEATTWATDPWEETTYPQASEEASATDEEYPTWEETTYPYWWNETTEAWEETTDPNGSSDSSLSADSLAVYFFSSDTNFDKLTEAVKSHQNGTSTVTYTYNGKTVESPKDIFKKGQHKYELIFENHSIVESGNYGWAEKGEVTIYIGVKGDANLDDTVNAKDSVTILQTFAYAITGQYRPLQSENSLEYLANYLADIDSESIDHNRLDSKDAVWTLQFYANCLTEKNTPWNELCKTLADSGKVYDETFEKPSLSKGNENADTVISVGTVTVKPNTAIVDVPVTISGNTGFAGGGFVFNYDSKLSFDSVIEEIITPERSVKNNSLALTFARSENRTANGTMFTLQFKLPVNTKNGDEFKIESLLNGFVEENGEDIAVKLVDGAIKVDDGQFKATVKTNELEVGEKTTIEANQENLTYATSDSNIAVVSKSGEITAISAGTVVITVINSDKETVSITVTVKNPVTTTSVTTTTKPPVTTTTKPDIMLGDVNIDGAVDSKDAVLVLKDYAQVLTGSKSSIDKARGDINGDNSIDSKDAVKILKYYANKMVGNTDIDIRNV